MHVGRRVAHHVSLRAVVHDKFGGQRGFFERVYHHRYRFLQY